MTVLRELLQTEFNFEAIEIKKIGGYDNANYKVTGDSNKYIFKTYVFSKDLRAHLEAENEVLLSLERSEKCLFPIPEKFLDESYLKVVEIDGEQHICRMLAFIDESFLAETSHSHALLTSFGGFLAELNLQLQKATSYVLQARECEWDLQYYHFSLAYIKDIPNAHNRSIVEYFYQQFEAQVLPHISGFRRQIIHGDYNEGNVLVKNDRVVGAIDFGDVTYAPLVYELGIALVYSCYDKDEPLQWIASSLKGYNAIIPIEEKEVEILYYVMAARLAVSVCRSAHSRKTDPDNTHALNSEKHSWKLLKYLLRIGPISVEKMLREVCQLPKRKELLAELELQKRLQVVSPLLSVSYKDPIVMEKAAFQYMYDSNGKSILDAYNNIPHVGHCHPKVVAAGQNQMAALNTNTRYLYPELSSYAEHLLSKFPKSLAKVFFVNSGSAAADLAYRMAYAHTKRKSVMVMEHGYHGNTQIGMEISDYKFSNKKGAGKQNHVLKVPIPDTYRGVYGSENPSSGLKYAEDAIAQMKEFGNTIGAFITEPIVGCGGQVPLAAGYLKTLYPAIRAQGGVCISDEVQTGFGRLGDSFWGFEMHGVVPDMVILGKPMGNGHPMGAVVVTEEISASFEKGVEFFSSFGGNPVSCAVGKAVLEVIEEEKLQENAKDVGDYYQVLLEGLKSRFNVIGDVRGSGLFIGVEIVKEVTNEPNTVLAQYIKNELRKANILISTDGPFDNVIKSKPPLCFTKENAKEVVDCLERILENI
ncbi:aminotransferase class III-fold pyridoxal phosphate-dependent enzyme [Flavobacteriales bacterium]|nr:aminotransferase class III-fold pyridoxal phosphate-dependent enzyme [Flavobacteriales bacterium]